MKLISIIGSPRSGTTYIAQQSSKILNSNLLPEAQWIISLALGRKINHYTRRNWAPVLKDIELTKTPLSSEAISQIVKKYENKNNLEQSSAFVEHTPQNILHFNAISKCIDFDCYIAPLRYPPHSIASLAKQDWFLGSELRAASFNFRCLLKLLQNRSKINFIDVSKDEKIILKKIRNILKSDSDSDSDSDRGDDKNVYSKVNMILNTKDLLKSHVYMKKNTISTNKKTTFWLKIISIPSMVLYYFLIRRVDD